MAAIATDSLEELQRALKSTPPPTRQELLSLLDKCTAELNHMSDALIRFSMAWISLRNLLDTQDQPTLFDKEKT